MTYNCQAHPFHLDKFYLRPTKCPLSVASLKPFKIEAKCLNSQLHWHTFKH